MDYLLSAIIGISSSYIASIIFNKNSKKEVPIIELSKDIRIYENDGREMLMFKMLNKTKFDLINIEIELFGIYNLDDSKVVRKKISLKKSSQAFIDKYDKDDPEFKYAIQCALSIDNQNNDILNYLRDKKYDSLMLFVKVENPYYGSVKAEHREYNIENIKSNTWMFESGDKILCRKKD